MFGLFKGKKGKTVKKSVTVPAKGAKPSSEAIRAQALANFRQAREQIGEETLDKVAQALQRMQEKKNNDRVAQARARVLSMKEQDIIDGVRSYLDDR